MDYYGLVLSNWSKFRNLQTPREETRRPPVFYWSYVYIIYTHTLNFNKLAREKIRVHMCLNWDVFCICKKTDSWHVYTAKESDQGCHGD